MIVLDLHKEDNKLLSVRYIPNDGWLGLSIQGGEYVSMNPTDLLVWAKAIVGALDYD